MVEKTRKKRNNNYSNSLNLLSGDWIRCTGKFHINVKFLGSGNYLIKLVRTRHLEETLEELKFKEPNAEIMCRIRHFFPHVSRALSQPLKEP